MKAQSVDAGSAGAPDARTAERRLVERARAGDHEAFAELVRGQQRRVFGLIANLLGRPEEVEDLAQQVFLKIYLSLPRFDFRAAFSTWVYRIVVNECLDYLRRRRAKKAPGDRELQVEDWTELERVASSPAPDIVRRLELRQTVRALLERLSPQDRTLLLLREAEGLSIEEVAAATGLKPNTVKVRLFRARQRLLEWRRRAEKTR